MSWLVTLTRRFGRLPIGWLQLRHHPGRLIAALTGVAFANILVFVQLGISSAMDDVVRSSYAPFRAHIVISPASASTLTDGETLTRRVMFQALAEQGVDAAAPLYIGKLAWKRAGLAATTLSVYGLAPEAKRFAGPAVAPQFDGLSMPMHVLIDSLTRDLQVSSLTGVSPTAPMDFEVDGHAVAAIGSFSLGAGFGWDGSMVVSDQTFVRLFSPRAPGTPSDILVDVTEDADAMAVVARLRARLADEGVHVRTLQQTMEDDVAYQATQIPMGSIVGAGVLLGILVGVVIVFQVLSTDVAAHLRDYATFKAIGYSHAFVLGIVFEEALILALLGFLPGVAAASAIYAVLAAATDLPFGMTTGRSATVLLGTFAACLLSGSIAAQRLRSADPADLF